MKYIILGTYIDTIKYPKFGDIVKSNDPAANNYQGWLINGLISNNICVKNIAFKTISPKMVRNESILINKINGDSSIKLRCKSIYKNHFQRFYHYYNQVSKCIEKDDVIIVYSLSLPALISAIIKAKKNKNKICVVIPDLPLHMSSSRSIVYRILKHIDNLLIKNCLKLCSHNVILSKYMSCYLPKNKRDNYIVIEGAYNNEIAANINCPYKQSEPYILYTGTLDQRYGICNLIDAFSSTGLNYNLVICGNGNESEKNYIIEKGESDKRIKYLGSLSYQDILFLQQNASLLVNPRNNKEEFTKYSFPSKTMEYLASGTPTLMYKLDGIPNEYYEYCYHIDGDDSIETLGNKITEILNKSEEENKKLGTRAKHFILKNKNGNAQALKIIEYINK